MKYSKPTKPARLKSFKITALLGFTSFGLFVSAASFATTLAPVFTLEGRLLNASGTASSTDVMNFVVGVYSPTGICLLYEQQISNVDLSLTEGIYRLAIGSNNGDPSRTPRDPGKTIAQIFSNSTQIRVDDSATTQTCPGGYTPAAGDQRVVRITVTPHRTGVAETLSPDLTITPVPHSTVAETVQGLSPTNLLQITGNSTPYVLNKNAIDTLLGPGGPSATALTDASGLHTHDSLYAKLNGSSSMTLSSGAVLGLGSFNGTTPAVAGAADAGKTWYDSLSNQIKYWNGSSVQTLGTSGSGVTSVTSAGAPITIGGTATAPTVGISQASSVSNGFLTSADWLTFNNKVSSQWTTSGANIYYSPGNVGIGTTAPGLSLEVNGTIGATNGNGGGGSYVSPLAAVEHGQSAPYSGAIIGVQNGADSVAGFHSVTASGHGQTSIFGLITEAAYSPATQWSPSTPGALQSGDYLSGVAFAGQSGPSAGYDMVIGAAINGVVSGPVSAGVLPTDLIFRTSATKLSGLGERMRITSAGNVGIGTTAPAAKLDVNGHIANSATTAPTVSACGTGVPAITGNDTRGLVTFGTSTATCTLTFATAYATAPYCVVSGYGGDPGANLYVSSTSTTTLVINTSVAVSGIRVNYQCMQ